jgi:hypothetical protein
MIISASYRTDIPAFYGEWFFNRVNAGYCLVNNPYNNRPYKVSLRLEDVDGIVFWTKNIGPFLDKLTLISEKGYSFIVQYTINGYPRNLEASVVEPRRSIEYMKILADKYGPRTSVWRYDTIIFSSLTPKEFHLGKFEYLAKALEKTTDEVTMSFAQIYKKTLRNMALASREKGFTWEDPSDSLKQDLVKSLAEIAASYSMQLTVCSQPTYVVAGTKEAHCIDAERLSGIANKPILSKLKGNRPQCACYISRDIGVYDTCPHGCVYCYAVSDPEKARKLYKQHDPTSEFLLNSNPIEKMDEQDFHQLTLL